MTFPFDREPADFLISVSTVAQLNDLIDPDQTRLVIRDKRVAYVESDKLFYAYDANIPGWVALTSAAPPLATTPPEDVDKSTAVIGISGSVARSDHKHDVSTAAPVDVGTANAEGGATSLARSNHVHNHGSQPLGTGTNHAVATQAVAGFMSATDKTKLDGTPSGSLFPPVDTTVELGAVDTTGAPSGSTIYNNEVDDIYVLDLVGSYTPDGLTVVAAAGGGYWVARTVGRWDDVQGSIANGAGAGLLTLEFYRDTRFNMYFMRHDQNDELNFVYQLNHRWKYDTDVYPHLHVVAMANPAVTQNVVIDGYYAWSRPNYTTQIPALAGWATFSQTIPIEPGDIYKQKILSLGAITPPVWARESTCLLIYFRRYGTGPGDTYTTSKDHGTPAANLGLLSSDVHYRAAHSGTVVQIPT